MWNQNIHKDNKCGVKGVYWDKSNSKWRVRITANGKKMNIGRFDTLEAAAKAYKTAALIYHGKFATS
jgi:hypothetical protein